MDIKEVKILVDMVKVQKILEDENGVVVRQDPEEKLLCCEWVFTKSDGVKIRKDLKNIIFFMFDGIYDNEMNLIIKMSDLEDIDLEN